MIDMMDVITQGEGGWLPQTNTSVFTNTITKTAKNENTNINTNTNTNTNANDRYDGCYH